MKGNRELDDLLIAYILKELNPEEESIVIEYIRSDENNKRHFEELRDTWRAIAIKKGLEKVDVNSEWEFFGQTIALEKQTLVVIKTEPVNEDKVAGESKRGEGKIGERISGRSPVRKILLSIAIAASVVLVIVSGWLFLTGKERDRRELSGTKPKMPAPAASILRHEQNTTSMSRRVVLPDGSEVILADKSEISYQEPFIDNKRDITLKGKADFTVASDKTRPFTVYSSDLATTALGTHFTVTAFENAENIIVRLNEGKVVVKSILTEKTKFGEGYYLLPGQGLIYNNRNYTARLFNFVTKNPGLPGNNIKENGKDSPDLPENNKGSWYMFNNQSLDQVFDQLKLLYNADIVYSKKDVYNLYFVGKFDKTDSLYAILNQIASLNNLKVSKKNNKFIITK